MYERVATGRIPIEHLIATFLRTQYDQRSIRIKVCGKPGIRAADCLHVNVMKDWHEVVAKNGIGEGCVFLVTHAKRLDDYPDPEVWEVCWLINGRGTELLVETGVYVIDRDTGNDCTHEIEEAWKKRGPEADAAFRKKVRLAIREVQTMNARQAKQLIDKAAGLKP